MTAEFNPADHLDDNFLVFEGTQYEDVVSYAIDLRLVSAMVVVNAATVRVCFNGGWIERRDCDTAELLERWKRARIRAVAGAA